MKISFDQKCWPDVELEIVEATNEEEKVKVRGHKAVLVSQLEWFRAFFEHPGTKPHQIIDPDKENLQSYQLKVPFKAIAAQELIDSLYDPKDRKNQRDFSADLLLASVYFGRQGDWLHDTLFQLIARLADQTEKKEKQIFAILQILLGVEGLDHETVKHFYDRYAGTLSQLRRSRLPPSSLELPKFPWNGPSCVIQEGPHTSIFLSGEYDMMKRETVKGQWKGLEFMCYTTYAEGNGGFWLTCRPSQENIRENPKGKHLPWIGVENYQPPRLARIRLRLFSGAPDVHCFNQSLYVDGGKFIKNRTISKEKKNDWEKRHEQNFYLPFSLIEDRWSGEMERTRCGHIEEGIDRRILTNLTYRFEIMIYAEASQAPANQLDTDREFWL